MDVSNHLCFHVAGAVEVALDKALAAAEGCDGLAGGGVEEIRDLLHRVGDLHAAATATEGGLHGNREAVFLGELLDLGGAGNGVLRSRCHGSIDHRGDLACGDLVAEAVDGLRRRADPVQASVDDGAGEVRVLCEEAVAGVNGIGAGLLGRGDQLVDVQVALGGGLPAQREGLVGHADVRGIGIRLGVHRDGGDALVLCGADDADRDFAAVGDHHLLDGGDALGARRRSSTLSWRARHLIRLGRHDVNSSNLGPL